MLSIHARSWDEAVLVKNCVADYLHRNERIHVLDIYKVAGCRLTEHVKGYAGAYFNEGGTGSMYVENKGEKWYVQITGEPYYPEHSPSSMPDIFEQLQLTKEHIEYEKFLDIRKRSQKGSLDASEALGKERTSDNPRSSVHPWRPFVPHAHK